MYFYEVGAYESSSYSSFTYATTVGWNHQLQHSTINSQPTAALVFGCVMGLLHSFIQ
jgi:hypothetical protein